MSDTERPAYDTMYIVTDGEFIKIGKTHSSRVVSRIAALQTANAREIQMVMAYHGRWSGLDLERRLHCTLRKHHVRGEWFRPADEAIRLLARVLAAETYDVGEDDGWIDWYDHDLARALQDAIARDNAEYEARNGT